MTITYTSNGLVAITPAAPGFGTALRTYRTRVGISQKRLARSCGFDSTYVSRLESGGRDPSREAVLTIADALNLPITERARLMAVAGFLDDSVTPDQVVALVVGMSLGRA